jgi:hypothetical protein
MQSGPEMMHAPGGNGKPMAQQPYMQRPQQHMMMGYGSPHGHPGHAGAGYQPMGYDHGRPLMYYPSYPVLPPMYPKPYNIVSDENPNSSFLVM